MAESTCLRVSVGILSFLVLGCGISFSTVLGLLQKEVQSVHHDSMNYSSSTYSRPYWYFGFTFMLSGLIGLYSSCAKTRGSYTAHLTFGIITLIIKSLVVIAIFLIIGDISVLRTDDCETLVNQCSCTDLRVFQAPCHHVETVYSMIVGACAVTIIGWILTLVNVIITGVVRSRCKIPVVMYQTTMSVQHPVAPPPYSPSSHDKSVLVNNMEYQPGVYAK